jgi:hypothetical protein
MRLDEAIGDDPKLVIKHRKLHRKKTAAERRLANLNERISGIEVEVNYLIRAFRTLEQKEPLKHYDDLASQKTYWNDKLSQEWNLRKLFGMPIDLELTKTILALNSDSPIKQEALSIIDENKKAFHKELERNLTATKRNEAFKEVAEEFGTKE